MSGSTKLYAGLPNVQLFQTIRLARCFGKRTFDKLARFGYDSSS
jgi:hypothetical protein